MDGIDAGIFNLTEQQQLITALTYPIPHKLRSQLATIIANDNIDDPNIQQIDLELGDCFAQAAKAVLQKANIDAKDVIAIGSHGQNISHHPNDPKPYSLQIGNAKIIAEQTRITTVANFRSADITAGGQGAPLAPLLHQCLARQKNTKRAIVNIGGIANVSFVSTEEPIIGFDTGPGNGLMDAWIYHLYEQGYDKNGQLAKQGKVDHDLLNAMLLDPYFKQPAPKSTGKEYFNLKWLKPFLTQQKAEDVQATLCELTALTIITAVEKHWSDCEIYICGGGVHNTFLLQRLSQLTKNKVSSSETINLNPDYLEAQLFAWLAKQRINNIKLDTTTITGAKEPVLLGDIFQ